MDYQIKNMAVHVLKKLWNNGNPNKAVLAGLRKSRDLASKNATVVWPVMLSVMDPQYLSSNGQPTKAERAIFATLHCYAIFQQGNNQCVYEPSGKDQRGLNLFRALAQLRLAQRDSAAIDRRVQNILGTMNFNNVTNSLNHLISILKSKSSTITVDFAELSQDLYYFQISNEASRRICLKWGQQYFATYNQDIEEK